MSNRQTLQARPGINGNTAADFVEASNQLYDLATNTIATIRAVSHETLHGRNYQHNPTARAADQERVAAIFAALEDLRNLSVEMFDAVEVPYR